MTVNSLITLNNIVTNSQNLFLRDLNVKPAGFGKMYLDKSLIEQAFYLLVGKFNERKVTHNQFCNLFLDLIHPFRDEIEQHAKFCLYKQFLIFLMFILMIANRLITIG